MTTTEAGTTSAGTHVGAVLISRPEGGVTASDGAAQRRPRPGPGATAHVGICGSDLEQFAGRMPETFAITYPHVLGNEWSGGVIETGPGVVNLSWVTG